MHLLRDEVDAVGTHKPVLDPVVDAAEACGDSLSVQVSVHARGDAVLLYLIAYPLGRFWVELFRPDAWVIGQLATAQWIALGCVIGSIIVMALRHRHWSWQDHPEESLAEMSGRRTVAAASQANSTQVGSM